MASSLIPAPLSVIPAQAGIQATTSARTRPAIPTARPNRFRAAAEWLGCTEAAPTAWIPACAGMTERARGGEEGWVLGTARYPRRARV